MRGVLKNIRSQIWLAAALECQYQRTGIIISGGANISPVIGRLILATRKIRHPLRTGVSDYRTTTRIIKDIIRKTPQFKRFEKVMQSGRIGKIIKTTREATQRAAELSSAVRNDMSTRTQAFKARHHL